MKQNHQMKSSGTGMLLRGLCLELALMCALSLGMAETAETEETAGSGSWSQINQSIARGEDWVRYVKEPADFQLGEAKALEGYPDLRVMDWGEYPSIDGSTVCVPLAMELARQWLDLPEEDLNGFVSFSTTPYAYDRLTQGKANPTVTIASRGVMMDDQHPIDIVLGTGPNADERKAAEDAGAELGMVPVCYDAFVFLAGSKNPVDTLSPEQIRSIYTGVTRLWSEVGGEENQVIEAYQRPHGSGSQTAMEELVMDGYQLPAAAANFVSDGMGDLIAQVGNFDGANNALGYSYLYYVDALYKSGSLKVLSIDGVAPTPENLRSGAYPYTVYYYAVYRKGNETAERFVDWLTSEEGQACVAQAGYVTLQ